MPTFLFRAQYAKTDLPAKVHITLGGVDRGFTPERKNEFLKVELSQRGEYSWYARKNGDRVGSGESDGGEIVVIL